METTWIENWATIPDTPSGRKNGRTHGVCVCNNGTVKVFHQAENGLLTYDPDGTLMSAVGGDRWLGAHGLTHIVEDGVEYLWVVDELSCEIAKVTLDGETVLILEKPDHPVYAGGGKYKPTWAAQNPLNGEIWTGDGYGSSLVNRYAKDGSYLESLRETPAGAFQEPHGLNFRVTSAGDAELFVTDRANKRIQVLDGEGNLLRSSMSCKSPCCFDFFENEVLVPELFTGVKLLDVDTLECLNEVGASDRVFPNPDGWWPPQAPEGWPNLAGTEHIQ